MADDQELEKVKKPEGAFVASLKRNNKQIKDDRAESIAEDAQMRYRRTVEDLDMAIKRMKRTRDNMLDLSPGSRTNPIRSQQRLYCQDKPRHQC